MMLRTVPNEAIEIIKEFEGFRAKAYRCPAGVLTIGYGTTEASGVGLRVYEGRVISEPHAAQYLRMTVELFAQKMLGKLKRLPTNRQWAAMISLAYNIGINAFARSSVLRKFNAGDDSGAADAFLLWNKANGKVLKGLVRRRKAERALFLTGIG